MRRLFLSVRVTDIVSIHSMFGKVSTNLDGRDRAIGWDLVSGLLSVCVVFSASCASNEQSGAKPTLTVVDVNVIDMTGAPERVRQTVLVAGDRITRIAPASEVKVPAGHVPGGMTALAVARAGQVSVEHMHGMEMFQKGDEAHLQAMAEMKTLMQSPDAMSKWMEERKPNSTLCQRPKKWQVGNKLAK